ncbi:hypothetical protein QTQ03_28080 [Micromonospora sp. WMMA1363]|uniref:hypothetical protein n=1 Tax=Micromonospora sp. WMMA1363 TaxID=3053985 RepID=UPI00259D09E1|nr:hypothetical protein [Micromonospora sp. WMMA1363]MDM4721180.1 hypothetical protein [Micromonospora sp. WMMA1363]MDM4723268.1 hypothetical protein [Micromonospora sp. WMMA1363]
MTRTVLHKCWMITLGRFAGLITVALFAALMIIVLSPEATHTPRLSLLFVGVLLLGFTSAALLAAGHIRLWLTESGDKRWWCGYSAAVKDLTDRGRLDLSEPAGPSQRG